MTKRLTGVAVALAAISQRPQLVKSILHLNCSKLSYFQHLGQPTKLDLAISTRSRPLTCPTSNLATSKAPLSLRLRVDLEATVPRVHVFETMTITPSLRTTKAVLEQVDRLERRESAHTAGRDKVAHILVVAGVLPVLQAPDNVLYRMRGIEVSATFPYLACH